MSRTLRISRAYLRTAASHCTLAGAVRKALGNFSGSISELTTQGWMLGILVRAMIGVVASASPELVGPQMALTLRRLIISWVALTALVGSPWVSRVTISILRPLTPPAALISLAAKSTPRSKPMAGAELGPVKAASQPKRIGSLALCAKLGRTSPWLARANPLAVPSTKSRRVIVIVPPWHWRDDVGCAHP